MEEFFGELKDAGLYDNSIICIYGDHYGLSCTDPEIKKMMTDLIGEDYNYKWHFNIPLIINIPGSGINETISTAGGQLDFLPTIAYLLGMDSLDTISPRPESHHCGEGLCGDPAISSERIFYRR